LYQPQHRHGQAVERDLHLIQQAMGRPWSMRLGSQRNVRLYIATRSATTRSGSLVIGRT